MRAAVGLLGAGLLLASDAIRLDVPFVGQQHKEGCGAAVLSMLIGYWRAQGADVPAPDPAAIHRELYSPEMNGVRAEDMARYLERAGFRTFAVRGDWALLEEHLARGRPLLACLREGGDTLHYVVVAGIDSGRGIVFVNDPARRKLMTLDRGGFERSWKDDWTLLAVPRATR